MANSKDKLNNYIDAVIDIIIDSYIAEKRRKEAEKYDKVDMSSTSIAVFDGRLGQSSDGLSSPGRPLKYGKEKNDTISKI